MKNVKYVLFLWAWLYVVMYLTISFILMEWNPAEWEVSQRAFFVIVPGLVMLIIINILSSKD